MIGYYTKDELKRLDAEWERVNKIMRSTRGRKNREYTKWRKRQDEIEAELRVRMEAERVKREARENSEEMLEWRARNAKENEIRQRTQATRLRHLDERTPEVMQRIRRSRVDWSEIIDDPLIAERQEQWERRRTALAMHDAGMTGEEIGRRLFISGGRAQQLVQKAWREAGKLSPGEQYLNNSATSVATAIANNTVKYRRLRPAMEALFPLQWPQQNDEDTWIWMGLAA